MYFDILKYYISYNPVLFCILVILGTIWHSLNIFRAEVKFFFIEDIFQRKCPMSEENKMISNALVFSLQTNDIHIQFFVSPLF